MRFSIVLLFILIGISTPGKGQSTEAKEQETYYLKSLDKQLSIWQAIDNGLKALDYHPKTKNVLVASGIEIQLGILYWMDGQFQLSNSHLSHAQQLAGATGALRHVAQCLHYKGLIRYYQCRFDSALLFYNEAEKKYRQLKNDSAVSKIKSHKGLVYSAKGQYTLAIQNMIESFQLQESLPGYRDLTIPIQFSSSVNENLYYQHKLEKDRQSLEFLKLQSRTGQLAFTLFNIGLDYYHLKNFQQALYYFQSATKHYQSLGQPSFINSIGDAFSGLGQYDSAIHYYQKWIHEVKNRGTQIYLAAAYEKMAACYQTQKKWNIALTYFDSAYLLNEKMGLKRSGSKVQANQSLILKAIGQTKEALREIDMALSTASNIGCAKDFQEYLEIKSEVLTALGEHAEANQLLSQSNVLRDSVTNGESRLEISRLQIAYEADKKNREVEFLQSQNKLKETKLQSRNLQIIVSFLLLGLVTFIGGTFYYRYVQKNKSAKLIEQQKNLIEQQNQVLEIQNREKEGLLHEMHHRVKNNLQIISSLIHLKSNQTAPPTRDVLVQLGNRIFTMGLIHEKLFQKDAIELIRLDNYLIDLGNHLLESFEDTANPIRFQHCCEPIEVGIGDALACGLVCNELMTNSIKYAFRTDSSSREIYLRLSASDHQIEMILNDNGQKAEIAEGAPGSFGLRFVDQLVTSKLAGSWTLNKETGFQACILFPMNGKG